MNKELSFEAKLARDIVNQELREFKSVAEAEDSLRARFNEVCGGEFNYYSFLDNRGAIYAILKDTIDASLGTKLEETFSPFMDVHNVGLGDAIEFDVEYNDLFRVGVIASGTTDIRRQTILNGKFSVATEKLAVKIYAELDMWISGRINWSKLIDRVVVSFSHEVGTRIYNVIIGAYASLPAERSGSGAFAAATLRGLIEVVEAEGVNATIYGTKTALAKIASAVVSEKMADQLNTMGHYGVFEGTPLTKLPQGKLPDGSLAISNDYLLIVPAGEAIGKIVIEGDAEVYDWINHRKDQQIEHMFAKRIGVGALISNNFAMYNMV